MTLLTADVAVPGIISGTGDIAGGRNNTDNVLVTFRFKNPDVKMEAAEEDFDARRHSICAPARSSSATAPTPPVRKLHRRARPDRLRRPLRPP